MNDRLGYKEPIKVEHANVYLQTHGLRTWLIVTGTPSNEEHNCDAMGCNSVEHVIYAADLKDVYVS